MSLKSKANLRKTTKGNLQKSKKMGANKSKKNSFRSNKNKGKNQKRLSKSKKRYSKSNQKGGRYDFFFPRDWKGSLDDKKVKEAWNGWKSTFLQMANLIKGNDISIGNDCESFTWISDEKNYRYDKRVWDILRVGRVKIDAPIYVQKRNHWIWDITQKIEIKKKKKNEVPTWYCFSFSRNTDTDKAVNSYIWVLDQRAILDPNEIFYFQSSAAPDLEKKFQEYATNHKLQMTDMNFEKYLSLYTGKNRPVRKIIVSRTYEYEPPGVFDLRPSDTRTTSSGDGVSETEKRMDELYGDIQTVAGSGVLQSTVQ